MKRRGPVLSHAENSIELPTGTKKPVCREQGLPITSSDTVRKAWMGGGHWIPYYALTRTLLNLRDMDFFGFFLQNENTNKGRNLDFDFYYILGLFFLSSSNSETVIREENCQTLRFWT